MLPVAVTARTSLDLLGLPYPFSQVDLLTDSDFAKFAAERRSRAARELPSIDQQALEELHRHGILVPLFRVDLTPAQGVPGVDISASLTGRHVHTAVVNELLRGAPQGRVVDPAAVGFQPWPGDRRRAQWPSAQSGYLYSRHQLLGLDVAAAYVAALKPHLAGERPAWSLEEASLPDQRALDAFSAWRSLAITLSALDTYYWPQITHRLYGSFRVWRTAFDAFDPSGMLAWLGLSLDQIGRQASSLRLDGSFRDDTGEFYELIRRADSEAWKSLRGDAAVAMDYRLSADILTRFAQALDPGGDYAGAQYSPLSQQGLSARPGSLDAALSRLRLSPFPTLVIGVEGETEYRVVPRVLDLLGITRDRNRIVIVDFGGSGQLALLARYAVEPVLGRDLGTGVVLDRPLTRFLVMTDAENKYKDVKGRNKQRRLLIESLTKNVPEDLRADFYGNSRRGRIVEIRTWGKLPFEFAHFTDIQIADAMLSAAKAPHPQGRAQLISDIHSQRGHQAPDVSKVFRAVPWPGSGLSKPALADALWPILEKKITTAIERGRPGPPVMRACVRAYEMAAVSEGVSTMLRRRPWRPRKP